MNEITIAGYVCDTDEIKRLFPQTTNYDLQEYVTLQRMMQVATDDPSRVGEAIFTACQMGARTISPEVAIARVFGGPRAAE